MAREALISRSGGQGHAMVGRVAELGGNIETDA